MRRTSERTAREALELHGGNLSAAARALGVARNTLREFIERRPKLVALLADLREGFVDDTEDGLKAAIARGDTRAIIYALNCFGRDRGWIEKPPDEQPGHLHLHLSEGELVRRLQALAAQMGRREPQQLAAPSETPIIVTTATDQCETTGEEQAEEATPAEKDSELQGSPPPSPPVAIWPVGVPPEALDE